MPKLDSRGSDRDDDLDVRMEEVDPNDVDNEDEDEPATGLTDIDDEDDPNGSDDHDDDSNDDENDEQDDPAPRRETRQQSQSRSNPRDAFLKRLKRAERQIAEVRDENQELVASNGQMRAELQKIRAGGDVDKAKKDADAKLTDIRAKLKVAIEAGDSDAQVTLQEQMSEIKAEVAKAAALAEAAKGAGDASKPVTRSTRLAIQWKRKHQRFNTDPAFGAFVAAVDRALPNEGFDSNTDAYWRELDKRVKERFPEEYKSMPVRRNHPSSGPDADGGSQANASRTARPGKPGDFQKRGKAFVLTQRQMSVMRKVGLDPDDAEDRKTFVRENQ